MRNELLTHGLVLNNQQKQRIIEAAGETYGSTPNSSNASLNLHRLLKDEKDSLDNKWRGIQFYLNQTQNINRTFYKIIADLIEEEISKTNTDIRFETNRILSPSVHYGAFIGGCTLGGIRVGLAVTGGISSIPFFGEILMLPTFLLSLPIGALIGFGFGLHLALTRTPISVQEQNDLFQRLMSINDEATQKKVVSEIKQKYEREKTCFQSIRSDSLITQLDEKKANPFDLVKEFAIEQNGMLTANNGTRLFKVINEVVTENTSERYQQIPVSNFEEKQDSECDGLNSAQKEAVIQEICFAGKDYFEESTDEYRLLRELNDEKITNIDKWTKIDTYLSESKNNHQKLYKIIKKEIDLEISKTDIDHAVNKKLIGSFSGLSHGLFNACTRKPIPVAEYQDLFKKLNSIHDAGVKTEIIHTVLTRYNNSWHLSQSNSSIKLVAKLSAKRLNCHEKFDYLKEYMTSRKNTNIYNMGKKLFNIIKEVVIEKTRELPKHQIIPMQ